MRRIVIKPGLAFKGFRGRPFIINLLMERWKHTLLCKFCRKLWNLKITKFKNYEIQKLGNSKSSYFLDILELTSDTL